MPSDSAMWPRDVEKSCIDVAGSTGELGLLLGGAGRRSVDSVFQGVLATGQWFVTVSRW